MKDYYNFSKKSLYRFSSESKQSLSISSISTKLKGHLYIWQTIDIFLIDFSYKRILDLDIRWYG